MLPPTVTKPVTPLILLVTLGSAMRPLVNVLPSAVIPLTA